MIVAKTLEHGYLLPEKAVIPPQKLSNIRPGAGRISDRHGEKKLKQMRHAPLAKKTKQQKNVTYAHWPFHTHRQTKTPKSRK